MSLDVFFVGVLRGMEIFPRISAHDLFDKCYWIIGIGGIGAFTQTWQFIYIGTE